MAQFIEVTPLNNIEGGSELINIDHIARVVVVTVPNRDGVPVFAAQLHLKDGSGMKVRESFARIARMIGSEHRVCTVSTLSPYAVTVEGEEHGVEYYVDSSEKDLYSAPEARA